MWLCWLAEAPATATRTPASSFCSLRQLHRPHLCQGQVLVNIGGPVRLKGSQLLAAALGNAGPCGGSRAGRGGSRITARPAQCFVVNSPACPKQPANPPTQPATQTSAHPPFASPSSSSSSRWVRQSSSRPSPGSTLAQRREISSSHAPAAGGCRNVPFSLNVPMCHVGRKAGRSRADRSLAKLPA